MNRERPPKAAARRATRKQACPAAVSTALVLVIGIACADSELPSAPTSPASFSVQPEQVTHRTLDEEFEDIARSELPGFAGYYIGRDSSLTVLIAAHGQREAALAFAAQQRLRIFASPSSALQVREVQFDFLQLSDWKDRLRSSLQPVISEVALDIDEVNNRISVWFERQELDASIRSAAAKAGVPAAAVALERRRLPRPRATLRDDFSPMWAGIQTWTVDKDLPLCTLGANVIYQGQAAFLTASHCTHLKFRLDGAIFRQASEFSRRVGAEIWDRGRYMCKPAPFPVVCRYSDAAIIGYDPGVTWDLGVIAFPSSAGYFAPGPIELGDPPNWYYISRKWTSSILYGQGVEKVGRTSGRTVGYVTNTCVELEGMLCQYVADLWSQGGDSGSPILVNHMNPGAALGGILWGGPPQDFTQTWFSPISGVERDLGSSLTVCYWGWGC